MIYNANLYGQKEDLKEFCSWNKKEFHRTANYFLEFFDIPETDSIQEAKIFPIDIITISKFVEIFEPEKMLGTEILEKLSEGNSILVFYFASECLHPFNHKVDTPWLRRLIEYIFPVLLSYGIPLNSIWWISGDLNADQKIYKNDIEEMNIIGIDAFSQLVHKKYNTYIPDDYFDETVKFNTTKEKDFLYLNGVPRPGKCVLKYMLEKEGLLSRSLYSWLHRFYSPNLDHIEYYCKKNNLTKYTIDVFNSAQEINLIDADNKSISVLQDIYPKSFLQKTSFSLVAETIQTEPAFFITEKTYKPILYEHPFLLYNNPKSLEYLKKLGYQTYDIIFDESYDYCHSLQDKIEKIISNINNFKENSHQKIYEVREIAAHNRKLFLNENPAKDVNKEKFRKILNAARSF